MNKLKFEIVEKNQERYMRGVEHNRVYIYEDSVFQKWLWMSDDDILKNKNIYGENNFNDGESYETN